MPGEPLDAPEDLRKEDLGQVTHESPRNLGCTLRNPHLSVERRYQPRPKAVGCMPKLRGPHFYELTLRTRHWDGQAVLFQTVDVEFDGFADQP
jgi:hypothetical protein